MKRVWLVVSVFLLGCLTGCLLLYSSVHDRIVEVCALILPGEVDGVLQKNDSGTVTGVQLYNGTSYHMVVTGVWDADGKRGEFLQLHMAKPVGRGYAGASRAVRLSEKIMDRTYAVLLPGDNAVLKFEVSAKCPVTVEYYLVGDNPEDNEMLVLALE
ncbi:MAG TPA: hypothetical protein GXX30_11340 [Firmicutes bacterium]|nr:hypothetical protein [Candidatus Fermentithermobacillaceae bacterium]